MLGSSSRLGHLVLRPLLEATTRALAAAERLRKRRKLAAIERRLERDLRVAFREQGRRFVRALRQVQDRFPVAEALRPGDWLPLFATVELETAATFGVTIEGAVEEALTAGALTRIATLDVALSFSLDNPRAVAYLADYGATRVTQINDHTRETLRGLLTQAADEGWSYDRTATAITQRFEEFAVGRPQQHVRSRAHLIAITEIGEAYEEGNLIAAQSIQAAGIALEKRWSTIGDRRVSQGCRDNEAAGWIDLDDAFPSGHQRPLRHPGCRCDLLIQRKED